MRPRSRTVLMEATAAIKRISGPQDRLRLVTKKT